MDKFLDALGDLDIDAVLEGAVRKFVDKNYLAAATRQLFQENKGAAGDERSVWYEKRQIETLSLAIGFAEFAGWFHGA